MKKEITGWNRDELWALGHLASSDWYSGVGEEELIQVGSWAGAELLEEKGVVLRARACELAEEFLADHADGIQEIRRKALGDRTIDEQLLLDRWEVNRTIAERKEDRWRYRIADRVLWQELNAER